MSARNTLSAKAARRAAREAYLPNNHHITYYVAVSHDEELPVPARAARREVTREAALARPRASSVTLPVEGRANRPDARPGSAARARRIRERRAELRLARRASR